jgi:2-phospho-L-lactate guanylyltransferase
MPPWSLVVPVKRLARAKTRLDTLDPSQRARLALAFAEDTVEAALACREVAGVVVVTDEPEARERLSALGAVVVPDRPDAGLNPALRYGAVMAARANPGTGVGALSADLPALRSADLQRALEAAAGWACSFVADRSGTGTVLLVAQRDSEFDPRFGPHSADRHRAVGVVEIEPADIDSLRLDVDTPEDLARALRLGVGTQTARVVSELPPARETL